MSNRFDSKEVFIERYKQEVSETYGREFEETFMAERYQVLGKMIRDYVGINWKETKNAIKKSQSKQLYYFSMEFLMGRLLTNNLMNLGIYDLVKEGLEELGMDINEMEEMESDAGLGNGGLGRLAACFMDSLASLDLAGHGNCIRYHYGLFKQKIVNNEQVELPDCWLKSGNIWEVWKPQHVVRVPFGGQLDAYMDQNGKFRSNYRPEFVVRAVPYDEPIIGYHTTTTNTLRLWDAEVDEDSVQSGQLNKYLNDVTAITANVYPDDSTIEGKLLRLKQEYFFVCAGINQIIRSHLRVYPTLDNLGDKVAIQLNDTHPVLVIPELMRVLCDNYDYEWDQAWEIVTKTVAYTNHTVMAEALEKWPQEMVQSLLPRIYMIIEEIDRRFKYEVDHKGMGHIWNNVAILKEGQVHMAHIAIVGSHSVNGVAKLHTEILIHDVMKDFVSLYPDRFNNKTNGITHRRWLLYSNPQLTKLLEETIGDSFKRHPEDLEKLMEHIDDPILQERFMNVKMERKQILADYVKKTLGIDVNVNSIFDCQAKRLHAYKRQLLNIFHVMHLYLKMKEEPSFRIYPRTFFFSAKAAPSYMLAKEIIKLINMVANRVNNDPETNHYLKVVFIPNYSVSVAEILLNAADVSEQISTAGKEASGTGNMKYMMNGALTLGTLDGANVEIVERVGYENAEIFGLRVEDIEEVRKENSYNAWDIYHNNYRVRRVIDSLKNCTWSNNPDEFQLIYNDLLLRNDEFYVLADFDAYVYAQREIENRYQQKSNWARTMLINIAQSGYFSSDRTIKEYAKEIWDLQPIPFEK
ncbi:starch phosphorylase [Faecalicoccus acidiformans]|uniref:Alpha-1,4 glucan phosphorylase n=1 Tax=Faecalicoccus acidiformans TaxID=915173 RepID=A0A7W8D0D6_9FIRM|nr:glycogen/starch/alpha-glucan phosphorylase [Faecalicoccus acidiformans]MBB5184651.1 starch phosphorylase [Faecalicoccus acidiformans]HIW17853.1 glycogen/starch/alpha-glucan phosphorylase [Candidatus Faecalicoccus intestinipullorum]